MENELDKAISELMNNSRVLALRNEFNKYKTYEEAIIIIETCKDLIEDASFFNSITNYEKASILYYYGTTIKVDDLIIESCEYLQRAIEILDEMKVKNNYEIFNIVEHLKKQITINLIGSFAMHSSVYGANIISRYYLHEYKSGYDLYTFCVLLVIYRETLSRLIEEYELKELNLIYSEISKKISQNAKIFLDSKTEMNGNQWEIIEK